MHQKSDNPSRLDLLQQHPLRFYIKKQKKWFSLGMLFLVCTNLLDGLYPLVLAIAIDQITQQASMNELMRTCLILFAVLGSLALTRYLWRVFFGRYHTAAAEDLRNKIFNHLTDMGPSFYQKNPIGELMSLMTNDVQSFRMAIGSGVLILVDGITLILILLPMMIWLNPEWTWKTLVFLPIVPLLIWKVHKVIFERYMVQQEKLSEVSGQSQEIVSGIRVIKSFALENILLSRYNIKSKELENQSNKVAIVDALFIPVMQMGVTTGTVILLFVAAGDIFAGVATVGTLVAFQRYISKMVWPMTALGLGISQFQKGMASYARIRHLLLQETDIPNHGTIELTEFHQLQVKNLDFTYPGASQASLKDINFTLNRGQTLGIVGPVGSGKTTLLHLLTRLYPIPVGHILINGIDINEYTLPSLRKTFGLVPQEAFLFSDSVINNVAYGKIEQNVEWTETDVQPWTDLTDITSEIHNLPQQFHSQLGERGVNLSGGQKQRLALSRGFILASPVILLDDVLSAVDTKTEEKIHSYVKENQNEQAKIIVTHRLSTVRSADQILVLTDGKIEAVGKHAELLKTSATYNTLNELQFGPQTDEVKA